MVLDILRIIDRESRSVPVRIGGDPCGQCASAEMIGRVGACFDAETLLVGVVVGFADRGQVVGDAVAQQRAPRLSIPSC